MLSRRTGRSPYPNPNPQQQTRNGGKRVTYDEALSTLQSLFPVMEKDAISIVLQAHSLDVERTIDALLSMSIEGDESQAGGGGDADDDEGNGYIQRETGTEIQYNNNSSTSSTTSTDNNHIHHNNIESNSTDYGKQEQKQHKQQRQRKKRRVRVELPSDFLRVPGYPNGYNNKGKVSESRRTKTSTGRSTVLHGERTQDELEQIMTDEQLALILQDELFLNEVASMMSQEEDNNDAYFWNTNGNSRSDSSRRNNGQQSTFNSNSNSNATNQSSPSFNMNLAAMGDGMKKRISAMYASFKNRNTDSRSRGGISQNISSSRSQTNQLHQSNIKNKDGAFTPLMSPEEDSDEDDEEEVIFFGSTSKGRGKHYNGKASFGGLEMSDLTMSPSKLSNSTKQGMRISGSDYTPSRGPGGDRSKSTMNSPNIVRVDQSNTKKSLAHGPWEAGESDEDEEEMGFDGFAIGGKGNKTHFNDQRQEINTESLMESSDESEDEAAIYNKYNYKPKKSSPIKGLLSTTGSYKNKDNETSRQSLHQHQNLL